MIDDPVLLNDWHAVARSADTGESQVAAARLLGEDLVVWRQNGSVMAWKDLCVHRGARSSLSRGSVPARRGGEDPRHHLEAGNAANPVGPASQSRVVHPGDAALLRQDHVGEQG